MTVIYITAARVIDAPAADIYAVLSDYRVGHNAILPKPYFQEMMVEEGGRGEGTMIRVRMRIFGQEFRYHQRVTEPEPGCLLVETDVDTGLSSSFTLEPLNGGRQTRVTIQSEFRLSPGFKGWMERLMNPPITRHIFNRELRNLEDYLKTQPVHAGD
jgi:hypothetical protein